METLESFEDKLVSSLTMIRKLRYTYNQNPRDYDECTRIIKADSVLLTRFMAIANSPAYQPRDYADKIRWVVQALHPKIVNYELLNMLMNIPYFQNLKRLGFNYVKYQINSVLVAQTMIRTYYSFSNVKNTLHLDLSKIETGQYDKRNFVYDLYFLGMIHDVGKLIIAEIFPDIYQRLNRQFRDIISDDSTLIGCEEELFHEKFPDRVETINHCWFADKIIKKLKYPSLFSKAVYKHHDSENKISHIAHYLHLCNTLYARELNYSYEGNDELLMKIDGNTLDRFLKIYQIDEKEFRKELSEVEGQMNSYIRYFNHFPPGTRFRIVDERSTDRIFRSLNNNIYRFLEKHDEKERIIVTDYLIRHFRKKLKDHYNLVHYFAADIAGSTDMGSSENDIVVQNAFGEFHTVMKDILSGYDDEAYDIIQIEGDCYIVQVSDINNAFSMQIAMEEYRKILSQRTGMDYETKTGLERR